MFIGKNGEDSPHSSSPDVQGERVEESWMLMLRPRSGDLVRNISGLHCVLKNLRAVCQIVQESEDCIRRKIIHLGHNGEPAILKTGPQDAMKNIGVVLSRVVCGCHFELVVVPAM